MLTTNWILWQCLQGVDNGLMAVTKFMAGNHVHQNTSLKANSFLKMNAPYCEGHLATVFIQMLYLNNWMPKQQITINVVW